VIVVVLALTVFSHIDRGDANPNYFSEMSTITGAVGDPSNDVEGTAQDREAIWQAARKLFVKHPIIGVGAEGFGPAAAQDFREGELPGIYGRFPGALWNKALHNVYYQVLSELGAVGFAILTWMLFDFHRKNSRLRSPPYRQAWNAAIGGNVELLYVALGLEAMMVAWIVCAYFYNVLFVPWFYGVLVLNLALYHTLESRVSGAESQPVRGRQASAARAVKSRMAPPAPAGPRIVGAGRPS
jgi:hypothetical protein